MTPYLLAFALVCAVLSYGLWYRRPWMWYVGWVFFYLFGAYFGRWFFSGLFISETVSGIVFASIYLFGGLLVWLPAVLWWSNNRHQFVPPKPDTSASSNPESI